ncbi:MAG: hypothetical protein ACRDSL_00155 [Pseudonocardiaceae bacterium]
MSILVTGATGTVAQGDFGGPETLVPALRGVERCIWSRSPGTVR